MNTSEFLKALLEAKNIENFELAWSEFESYHYNEIEWVAVGGPEHKNNRGIIELSRNPGRSLVERLTNGIDAILEAKFEEHKGYPNCRSPRESAIAWLNVPEEGLSALSQRGRQMLAQKVDIKLMEGERRESRTVEIRDYGIGLTPEQMPGTILSLNADNKWQKYYLAGTYGQGGSCTFAISKYTLIASYYRGCNFIGFTIVKYHDLPPDIYKTGHYVYLTIKNEILKADANDFQPGTLVRHYGYDLSAYPSPVGPSSIYGLLQQTLFDPVMPVWFDNHVHNYRRVIKGSRNALNGAVDEGDEAKRGPSLSHSVKMFYSTLGDFGRIGIEYWVLEEQNIRAYVDPRKTIILTLNGQNQAEISSSLVRKKADLLYLVKRLIIHVQCDNLTHDAKRILFVSTREDVRTGVVIELIKNEIISALKSDQELERLNNEAREQSIKEHDEIAELETRKEVAKLLRMYGVSVTNDILSQLSKKGRSATDPKLSKSGRRIISPIDLKEPPTYIKIIWKKDDEIGFYPKQRRWIRIETDANSTYYNPRHPNLSRINIIYSNSCGIHLCGSTPLTNGRMRLIFESFSDAKIGETGVIRVELIRPGLVTLFDEKNFKIVKVPPARPSKQTLTLPPFNYQPVEGPEDPLWDTLNWPENINNVAFSFEMESGSLKIFYSTVFPEHITRYNLFERMSSAKSNYFRNRYRIWIAVHSLLSYQDEQTKDIDYTSLQPIDEEYLEKIQLQEKCRIAKIAVLFSAKETENPEISIE